MKVLVISLRTALQRRQRIERLFGEAGVEFEFLDAIDAADLSAEDMARWVAGVPSFNPLTPGEVACFLSHRACWQRCVEAGEAIAIFEDDIHLGLQARELLADPNWVPAGADIIKLETAGRWVKIESEPVGVVASRTMYRMRSMHLNAAGYVITASGARKSLDQSETFCDPVDHLLFDPASGFFDELEIIQLCPALCVQDFVLIGETATELRSSLQAGRRAFRRKGWRKLWREIERPFDQLREFVMRLQVNWTGRRERYARIPFI
jgi:glycosyl transferase, family 25